MERKAVLIVVEDDLVLTGNGPDKGGIAVVHLAHRYPIDIHIGNGQHLAWVMHVRICLRSVTHKAAIGTEDKAAVGQLLHARARIIVIENVILTQGVGILTGRGIIARHAIGGSNPHGSINVLDDCLNLIAYQPLLCCLMDERASFIGGMEESVTIGTHPDATLRILVKTMYRMVIIIIAQDDLVEAASSEQVVRMNDIEPTARTNPQSVPMVFHQGDYLIV